MSRVLTPLSRTAMCGEVYFFTLHVRNTWSVRGVVMRKNKNNEKPQHKHSGKE
jgi:hypothetical protein